MMQGYGQSGYTSSMMQQQSGPQPLTAKELEYTVDSMSNEESLVKQLAVIAATAQEAEVKQLSSMLLTTHEQHYHELSMHLDHKRQYAPSQMSSNASGGMQQQFAGSSMMASSSGNLQ